MCRKLLVTSSLLAGLLMGFLPTSQASAAPFFRPYFPSARGINGAAYLAYQNAVRLAVQRQFMYQQMVYRMALAQQMRLNGYRQQVFRRAAIVRGGRIGAVVSHGGPRPLLRSRLVPRTARHPVFPVIIGPHGQLGRRMRAVHGHPQAMRARMPHAGGGGGAAVDTSGAPPADNGIGAPADNGNNGGDSGAGAAVGGDGSGD
jgi:hypothetical protein